MIFFMNDDIGSFGDVVNSRALVLRTIVVDINYVRILKAGDRSHVVYALAGAILYNTTGRSKKAKRLVYALAEATTVQAAR